jgi:hypothetical protein
VYFLSLKQSSHGFNGAGHNSDSKPSDGDGDGDLKNDHRQAVMVTEMWYTVFNGGTVMIV